MIFPAASFSRWFFVIFTLLLFCHPSGAEELSGKVEWIYDGDTIRVKKIGKVRLVGIDAPEMKDSPKDAYYRKRGIAKSTLRRVAAEATHFNIQLTGKKIIRLKTARHKRDDYGRLLAYVYLPDGRLLNRLLVENGLAAVYRRFDFEHKKDFLKAEQKARKDRKGLWE